MTKEEFLKQFGDVRKKEVQEKNQIKEVKEPNTIKEVVLVDIVYNYNLNQYKKFPPEYMHKAMPIWFNATKTQLKQAQNIDEEKAKKLLEKTKVAKQIVKEKKPVKMTIKTVAKYTGDKIHHWKIYAVFEFETQALHILYKNKGLKKTFIFTDEGVFNIKTPPSNIPESTPYGFIGIDTINNDKTLVIIEK